jgi:hypothetical protein
MQSWTLVAHFDDYVRVVFGGTMSPQQAVQATRALVSVAVLRDGPLVICLAALVWRMRWSEWVIALTAMRPLAGRPSALSSTQRMMSLRRQRG